MQHAGRPRPYQSSSAGLSRQSIVAQRNGNAPLSRSWVCTVGSSWSIGCQVVASMCRHMEVRYSDCYMLLQFRDRLFKLQNCFCEACLQTTINAAQTPRLAICNPWTAKAEAMQAGQQGSSRHVHVHQQHIISASFSTTFSAFVPISRH